MSFTLTSKGINPPVESGAFFEVVTTVFAAADPACPNLCVVHSLAPIYDRAIYCHFTLRASYVICLSVIFLSYCFCYIVIVSYVFRTHPLISLYLRSHCRQCPQCVCVDPNAGRHPCRPCPDHQRHWPLRPSARWRGRAAHVRSVGGERLCHTW